MTGVVVDVIPVGEIEAPAVEELRGSVFDNREGKLRKGNRGREMARMFTRWCIRYRELIQEKCDY
jgi:hypothetical protein